MSDRMLNQPQSWSLTGEELDGKSMSQAAYYLEIMPDAFITYDHEWRFLYINQQAERLLGRKREELLGKVLWEIYPQYIGSLYDTKYHESAKKQQPLDFESFNEPLQQWFAIHTEPSSKGLAVYFSDITGRKRLEEERDQLLQREQQSRAETEAANQKMRKSQDRLTVAQQASQIGTFEWDVSNNQIFWTPELEALYGLPTGAFEGHYENWACRVHPEDLPRVEEHLKETLANTSSYNTEFRIICPDGSIRWLLGKGELARDADGKPGHMIGVNIDITERKEAEQNLARVVNQLRFLSESSKLLASSQHYQEVLLHVAKCAVPAVADWCCIALVSDDELIQPLTVMVPDPEQDREELNPDSSVVLPNAVPPMRPPRHAKLYIQTSETILATIVPNEHIRTRLRANGPCSAMLIPLIIQDTIVGSIVLVVSEARYRYSVTDLSIAEELADRLILAIERARTHQNLQELNNNLESLVEQRTAALQQTTEALHALNTELQRSNQELQDFAYVASHDLQEPLRKIQAFGNLLEEEYGQELGDGRTYLERMRNAATRMRRLITDLLTFSRVTTKAQPFSSVDLNVIIHDVLGDLETRIQASEATVEVDKLPTLDADAWQMYQMFQNLLSNALKFNQPGVKPVITITSSLYMSEAISTDELQTAPRQFCQLRIEDNGIGFDEKYLDRIFTVFQRLHGKSEYEGTGIGLAVVRKIVERHGGAITAQSAEGAGATFIVTLPVAQTVLKDGETK